MLVSIVSNVCIPIKILCENNKSRFLGKKKNPNKIDSSYNYPRLRERTLSQNSNLFCGKLYKNGRVLYKADINWLVKTQCPLHTFPRHLTSFAWHTRLVKPLAINFFSLPAKD